MAITNIGASAAAALIEFRLVHDEPAVDREPHQFQGETLYLESAAVVSDPDFQAVRPMLRPEQLLIDMELTPDAAARLNRVTRENIDRRMALLLDSRVREVPGIRSAVGSPLQAAIRLSSDLSEDEARGIAERLRARWPQRENETGR